MRSGHIGGTYKGIIWHPKREKPVGFLCGQRYYWTKVLRIGLLAGFSALIFRNQNPAYTIKKGRGNSHLLAGISNSESEWIHLLAELHSCTGFNAAACPLRCVACYRCFWCQSLSLSCNVADNHWPLDEMLPVRQGGLQKGVCCEF